MRYDPSDKTKLLKSNESISLRLGKVLVLNPSKLTVVEQKFGA